MQTENSLSSVRNALKILHSFTMNHPQKGVRELAKELGIGKSSVQRILITLASEGFVKKDNETNKYELGVSVLGLSSIVLANIELHTESLPEIKKLAERCQLTCHLVVLENLEIVYVHKEEGRYSINLPSYSGLYNHSHCTSSGKLLLAYSDPAFREVLIERGLTQFTPNTITNPTIFRDELRHIYKKGYSVSNEEFQIGVNSISTPIRDHSGKVIAAVNLVGSKSRLSKQRFSSFTKELKQTGVNISEKLGHGIMSKF
ncbi:IclR family transcriptional regulator [Salicibibacter kimchii]|uniref:Glycerol operon regulatory protein n=1 Tax=Salicibibacter kimchii TaxID=2099786 RepID=A0A345C0N2_9BACI|nr:IclR family transcriptional regulator [Salicibibacter kimchii]AXF56763.1 IclR family transcriptional regulator [Salicibibacter kimchii]